MKARTLKEIRTELKNYPTEELYELCLRMARFKKDNKELLTYLLFESEDEASYVENIKAEIDLSFKEINRKSGYLNKKGVRKILKETKQAIRYSNEKSTEVDLLCYFCRKMRSEKIPMQNSLTMRNLYATQLRMAENALCKLHEDYRVEFEDEISWLKA
ncbi:MAG: hypothetical protein ACK5JS_01905 [Mangrovibacterium sp.]